MDPEPVAVLTSLIFPLASVIIMSQSYFVGGTLLVGTGFLAVYTLVSKSRHLFKVEKGLAARILCTGVSALLVVTVLGGTVSLFLWQSGFVYALTSGSSLHPADSRLAMLSVDLELFYLLRPALPVLLIILSLAAVVTLFAEVFHPIVRSADLRPEGTQGNGSGGKPQVRRGGGTNAKIFNLLPYLVLALSAAIHGCTSRWSSWKRLVVLLTGAAFHE